MLKRHYMKYKKLICRNSKIQWYVYVAKAKELGFKHSIGYLLIKETSMSLVHNLRSLTED